MSILNSTKRCLFIIPEFAEFCHANARENSISSSITRNSWDGNPLEINRRKDPVRASNYHVSLIGHITSDELKNVTQKKDYSNGLLNRFIFCFVDRSKILPRPTDITKINIANESAKLSDVFKFIDSFSEANPLHIDLADEAKDLWDSFYHENSYEEDDPRLDNLSARLPPHALRIAMIFALLDKSSEIKNDHLQASIDICKYHDATTRYLFTTSSGQSKNYQFEAKLISFLESQPNLKATRTLIIKNVFKNNGDKELWNDVRDELIHKLKIDLINESGIETWALKS